MHPGQSAAAQLSPPDGGFGWMVVFGSCLIHVVADGVTYSFGALLPILMEYFDAGEASVGAVGSTLFGVTLVVGPIAGALVNRFGCRPVTCVGGVIATIGIVISIYSPDIGVMTLTFGVIGGFGFGLIYLPAIVSVTQWFELKRSLATGIAVCGSGLGTVLFGYVAPLLVEAYDWRGAVLVIAGIVFNCCVFGALFRPVEYDVVAVINEGDGEPDSMDSVEDEVGELKHIEATRRQPKISTSSMGDKYGTGMLDGRNASMMSAKSDTHLHFHEQNELRLSRTGPSRHSSVRLSSSSSGLHGRSRLRLTEVGKDGSVTGITEVALESPFTRKDALYTGSLSNMALFREDKQKYKASVLDLSNATGTGVVDGVPKLVSEYGEETTAVKVTWLTKASNVFFEMMDPTLLKDWVFIWFSISNFFTSLAFQVPYIFVVDKATKELNIEYKSASFLLSIIGIANVVGRVAFGYLSDQPRVNRLWLYNLAVIIAGAAMFFMIFPDGYYTLAACAAFFGTFIGAFVTLTPVLLVDLFGIERLTNAFGILLLFQGIAAFVGPPLAGLLKEASGNYDTAFVSFGIMMAGSGAMLFLIPCLRRMEVKFSRGKDGKSGDGAQYSIAKDNGNAHNGTPSEHIRLMETGTKDNEKSRALPVIQINDRRASGANGTVMA